MKNETVENNIPSQKVDWINSASEHDTREKFGFDIDPTRFTIPSEAEINRLLIQEGTLRRSLKKLPVHLHTAEEIAELAVHEDLSETLKQWAYFHVLNRTISLKRGADVMVVPTSQTLLQAAEILKK